MRLFCFPFLVISLIHGTYINYKTLEGIFGPLSDEIIQLYNQDDFPSLLSKINESPDSATFSTALFKPEDLLTTIFSIKEKFKEAPSQLSYMEELKFIEEIFAGMMPKDFYKFRSGIVFHMIISSNILTQEETNRAKEVLATCDRLFQKKYCKRSSDKGTVDAALEEAINKEFFVPSLEDAIALANSFVVPNDHIVSNEDFLNGKPFLPYFYRPVLDSYPSTYNQEFKNILFRIYSEVPDVVTYPGDSLSSFFENWIYRKNSDVSFQTDRGLDKEYKSFLKSFRKASSLGPIPLVPFDGASSQLYKNHHYRYFRMILTQIAMQKMRRKSLRMNKEIDGLSRKIFSSWITFFERISIHMAKKKSKVGLSPKLYPVLVNHLKKFLISAFLFPTVPFKTDVIVQENKYNEIDLKSFVHLDKDPYPQLKLLLEQNLFELLALRTFLPQSPIAGILKILPYKNIINLHFPAPQDSLKRQVLEEVFILFGDVLGIFNYPVKFDSFESSLQFFALLLNSYPERRKIIHYALLNRISLLCGRGSSRERQLTAAIDLLNFEAYLTNANKFKTVKTKISNRIFF
jgi:hypothetical protein